MKENWLKEIEEKLALLKKEDTAFNVFGSKDHEYLFKPKVEEKKLLDFEQKNNFKLPKEYREFLAEIGNGGAGPCYGLQGIDLERPKDFRLKEDNEIDLSSLFPHQKKWNADWIEEIDWEKERPEEKIHKEYWSTSNIKGAYPICHYGHGDCYLLILNGIDKGSMWFDGRGDYGGLEPELDDNNNSLTFSKWYLNWLNSELKNLEIKL